MNWVDEPHPQKAHTTSALHQGEGEKEGGISTYPKAAS